MTKVLALRGSSSDGTTRHRVHQLGAALITVTLEAPDAQALAVLLSRRHALPRQAQQGDDDGWPTWPAETSAVALAVALRAHGTGAYARVRTSDVSASLTPQTAQVVAALTARPGVASRGKRPTAATGRRLGPGFEGVASH
ncbi:hypothetical protein OQI_11695 [Streptomyces pharetrae CZA14]|uniref:Uncharacterized protein n=1 Tax=Streptomyces pharetrae CZA14 TaxID=1144883 RepID=A0ABX3YN63_9ACTN|nr:hypothetical protein OQI_11695 [Streptomyces pharetrae CZA14]